jgi:hypothetical protein
MAYREVRMMDIDQVMRRWLVGEGIRAIGRSTGLDRNTVRRIVRLAEEAGVRSDMPWPDEGKLQAIRQGMGRPGAAVAPGEAEQRLRPRTDQIRAWLEKDHLLLTKVHELLGREGLVVSYSALYRFARKWCDFGTASSITVRRAESLAGEMAEVDFGRLGLLQELRSRRPRVVHGFIMTLGYSRLSCVIPVFKQDLPTVIDCFERALASLAVADGSGGLSNGLGKGIRISCSPSAELRFLHSRTAKLTAFIAARIICQREGDLRLDDRREEMAERTIRQPLGPAEIQFLVQEGTGNEAWRSERKGLPQAHLWANHH